MKTMLGAFAVAVTVGFLMGAAPVAQSTEGGDEQRVCQQRCGDGYCATRCGETATSCPADCGVAY